MPIPLGILAVAGAGGGAAGSYELIESVMLSNSTTSTVTFSNIDTYASTYKHLQLRFTMRTTRSSALDYLDLRVNSDGGSTYKSHELAGDGSSVSATNTTPTGHVLSLLTIGNTSTSNIFGAGVIDILDFGSTSKNKTFRSMSGEHSSIPIIEFKSGLWINTAAITSLMFYPKNGPNFLSGSRFSLYGIKG